MGAEKKCTALSYGIWGGSIMALYLLVQLAFPFVASAYVRSVCAPNTGTCGAMMVYLGIMVKPAILALLALILAFVVGRRAIAVNQSFLLGVFVLLLLLVDWRMHLMIGAHWGAAFATGTFSTTAPFMTSAALTIVIFIGLLPEPNEASDRAVSRTSVLLVVGIMTVLGLATLLPRAGLVVDDRIAGILLVLATLTMAVQVLEVHRKQGRNGFASVLPLLLPAALLLGSMSLYPSSDEMQQNVRLQEQLRALSERQDQDEN